MTFQHNLIVVASNRVHCNKTVSSRMIMSITTAVSGRKQEELSKLLIDTREAVNLVILAREESDQ